MLLVYCMVNFPLARPADQRIRQLGSAAGLLAKKIGFALTVVMES